MKKKIKSENECEMEMMYEIQNLSDMEIEIENQCVCKIKEIKSRVLEIDACITEGKN